MRANHRMWYARLRKWVNFFFERVNDREWAVNKTLPYLKVCVCVCGCFDAFALNSFLAYADAFYTHLHMFKYNWLGWCQCNTWIPKFDQHTHATHAYTHTQWKKERTIFNFSLSTLVWCTEVFVPSIYLSIHIHFIYTQWSL